MTIKEQKAWDAEVEWAKTSGHAGSANILAADAELHQFRAARKEAAKCNDKGCGWMDGHSLCKNCTDALRLLRQVRK